MLKTESPRTDHADLDLAPLPELLDALIGDQQQAVAAVQRAAPQLAAAVEAALPRLAAGGRLVYVGAGTSGRLGVLDGVELTPTFSWPPQRTRSLLAGGEGAMFHAVEGAEDDEARGEGELMALAPQPEDVVLLLAASGSTPYVLGALRAARRLGALSIGFANNPDTPLLAGAEIPVLLDSGAELISGSTRLKAGTAQKIALNAFSSALMVRLHKVYGNLMVDLRATNAKLLRRALALTQQASGADEAAAREALGRCGQQVKLAVLVLRSGLSPEAAQALLDAHQGDLRAALNFAAGLRPQSHGDAETLPF